MPDHPNAMTYKIARPGGGDEQERLLTPSCQERLAICHSLAPSPVVMHTLRAPGVQCTLCGMEFAAATGLHLRIKRIKYRTLTYFAYFAASVRRDELEVSAHHRLSSVANHISVGPLISERDFPASPAARSGNVKTMSA
jgi:hypothetical protein